MFLNSRVIQEKMAAINRIPESDNVVLPVHLWMSSFDLWDTLAFLRIEYAGFKLNNLNELELDSFSSIHGVRPNLDFSDYA
jgi:hypothetical protein